MNELAIKVEGLSKRYRIGLKEEIHDTLVGAAMAFIKSPVKNLKRLRRLSYFEDGQDEEDIIWALKEVSFEVQKGEVVGVIGRNGAGKSTLLKVLAGITYPTAGRAEIDGRVASLLEVGTGFHQELTGRENVYLNGTILGMTRKEIDRKFDEIVEFSGVEKFIDTPVKRYSSGMRVRLAFSVAAHLEAEILLIDEVLAVGDTAFQQKCLGKMGEVSKEGKTVLFVSHSMGMIRYLCSRALLIDKGKIQIDGNVSEVTDIYLQKNVNVESVEKISRAVSLLVEDPAIKFISVDLRQNGQSKTAFVNNSPIEISIEYVVNEKTTGLRVYFDLLSQEGIIIIRSFHDEDHSQIPTMMPGRYISKVIIPENILSPRGYDIRISATIFNVRACLGGGITIPVTVVNSFTVNRAYVNDTIRSLIQPKLVWHTDEITG
jgi:lipopolysaccharide transport system ATP-binding protein